MHDQKGKSISNPVFPFELEFRPNPSVTAMFSSSKPSNLMQYVHDLTQVPANVDLYDVYALDKPSQIGGNFAKIGSIQLDGKLVTSKFGDENLFFRHQFMNDDLKLHPEWVPYTASYKLGGKCPYQTMLEELDLA